MIDYFEEILRRRPDDWDGSAEKFAAAVKAANGDVYQAPTLISGDGVHPSYPRQYAAPSEPVRPSGIPEYKGIVTGARLLTFFARLLGIIGALALAGAVVLAAIAVARSAGDRLDTADKTLLVSGIVGCVFYGIGCFIAAVFLGMQASLSLAIRDLARNSFRQGD